MAKFSKNKLLLINICLLSSVIFFGLAIFKINIKTLFKKPVCNHCNVILISLDTLGGNHLPCYGYDRNTAQNLCNFAKNNIQFTRAFSNASWTLPSHFSIFTSLYPNHHNMINYDNNILGSSISTMAELFKKAGYQTIYVGPFQDPTLPLNRGTERGFDTKIDSISGQTLASWDQGISQLIKNNNNQQSTFLFLHTYWVHAPYVVNDVSGGNKRLYTDSSYPDIPLTQADYNKFSKEFKDFIINLYQYKMTKDNNADKIIDQNLVNSLKSARDLDEAQKIYNKLLSNSHFLRSNFEIFYLSKFEKSLDKTNYTKALYDEMIYYLDQKLTKVFNLVSDKKLANDTIIIITADHGEEFMEHGDVGHSADRLYNTTTTVPLIMYIPGIKQKKINNLAESVDILPTVLALTGLDDSKNNFDGINLTDLILGRKEAKSNNYLISEGPNDSIRNDRWKLYVSYAPGKNNTYELYDLYNDPLEKNNLAQKEPKIVKDLDSSLNKIIYKK